MEKVMIKADKINSTRPPPPPPPESEPLHPLLWQVIL